MRQTTPWQFMGGKTASSIRKGLFLDGHTKTRIGKCSNNRLKEGTILSHPTVMGVRGEGFVKTNTNKSDS